jgi:hypothetical protein
MAALGAVPRPGVRVLSPRLLGRAALDRQLLLRRVDLPVVDAVERLLGLNAQSPNVPYVALWSRLDRFAIADLTRAVEDRSLVRSTLMRATQHLLSAPDFRLVRPVLAALLRRVQRNAFGSRTAGIDLAPVTTPPSNAASTVLRTGEPVGAGNQTGVGTAQRRSGSGERGAGRGAGAASARSSSTDHWS